MTTTTTPAVSIRGLQKRYGDVVAVAGLDLEVQRGECFGLLGPNGAGKTTTIEICEGLNEPDAGEVRILGMTHRTDADRIRASIGISLQETQLTEKLTVEETVRLFRSFYPTRRPVDEAIAAVQLGEKRTARVGQLSGGQKQRLALACALVGSPELFFLDEPTTGLDPQSRRQLWDLIEGFKQQGRTVVLTTHYMDEAEQLCDRVAIVDHGRIIASGTPRQLIAMLGSEHVIEFGLDGEAIADASLASLPGVTAVRRQDGRHLLEASQIHQTIPALLAMLERERAALTDLTTHTATLEDVFVHLTGRHLRDG
ncbi:MAG: ABC transporter ATP-binding protein [Gemmatimonadales bacterium]|nr:ABC transporter ATP-binding protein [Gemmatimonadales bacterium]